MKKSAVIYKTKEHFILFRYSISQPQQKPAKEESNCFDFTFDINPHKLFPLSMKTNFSLFQIPLDLKKVL